MLIWWFENFKLIFYPVVWLVRLVSVYVFLLHKFHLKRDNSSWSEEEGEAVLLIPFRLQSPVSPKSGFVGEWKMHTMQNAVLNNSLSLQSTPMEFSSKTPDATLHIREIIMMGDILFFALFSQNPPTSEPSLFPI